MSYPAPSGTASSYLPHELASWLQQHADTLHAEEQHSKDIVPALARHGLFALGVPSTLGGDGGNTGDVIRALAEVAQHSMTAAFVFWSQRTFIEYLLQSPNQVLRDKYLHRLVDGGMAGASGLSNAMKFLGGIEALQITADKPGTQYQLNGKMHWVTNLHKQGFVVAAAVERNNQAPFVAAIPSDADGLVRSEDLDLIGLRGSNTAAIDLNNVALHPDDILHEDAQVYLPAVRPAFLGIQCGMSIGLAQASLDKAQQQVAHRYHLVLSEQIRTLQEELTSITDKLIAGVLDHRFRTEAATLFRYRIRLIGIVSEAVHLELVTRGGRAYLQQHQEGFVRRLTESSFIPIVTPSQSQLQSQLDSISAGAA